MAFDWGDWTRRWAENEASIGDASGPAGTLEGAIACAMARLSLFGELTRALAATETYGDDILGRPDLFAVQRAARFAFPPEEET